MKKLLLIIDPQVDFISGTLPVPGASIAMNELCKHIEETEYNDVMITVDWHPYNHCSFETQGGQWPVHCVQHSIGAAIDTRLLSTLALKNSEYIVHPKGDVQNLEEYSFLSIYNNPDDQEMYPEYMSWLEHITGDYDEIVIAGLAGDVCVKNTLMDLLPIKEFLKVLEKGTASLDGGDTLKEFCDLHKIEMI